MSLAHASWSPAESTERPMIFTFQGSNSDLIFAMYPSSVVQTGVKSFGCEKRTAQESPIQSWNWIFPSVVSASKSGAVSLIWRAILILLSNAEHAAWSPLSRRYLPDQALLGAAVSPESPKGKLTSSQREHAAVHDY